MPRGLKFRIKEVEGLYYPCSENKGADQLRGCRFERSYDKQNITLVVIHMKFIKLAEGSFDKFHMTTCVLSSIYLK